MLLNNIIKRCADTCSEKMQAFVRKEMSVMLASFLVLLVLLPSSADSSVHNHTNIQQSFLKLNPQLSFQVIFHAFLLWTSMGFLMPVGVLVIRMSNTVECEKKLKALFYLHLILQIIAVFLSLSAVILSIIYFENSFNNTHQRVGLALYVLTVIQPLLGFFRPQRGVKFRSMWYFVHWFVGNGTCIMGIINIYIGLHAFHARTSKSVRLWTILFTVEVCIIAFIYLLQDRWNYMQKQGVILGNDQITPTHDHSPQSTQKGS